MANFSFQDHLNQVYADFPRYKQREPVIGITLNYGDGLAKIMDRYYKQVEAAGATPLLIAPTTDLAHIQTALDRVDGLILSGGADFNPLWAGEQPSPRLGGINGERDLFEMLITRLAYNRNLPILGICRGIQTLAMALEGKVAQDIYESAGAKIRHSQDAARNDYSHTVNILPDSILAGIYGEGQRPVNSFHHQAVLDPGPHFRVTATAPDGIIEGIESTEFRDILGVQWHPEWLGDDGLKIFLWLRDRAAEYQHARELHRRNIIFDSHCDTPMFFPQGISFDHRDPRILVDLYKMDEGRQDATTMVAYLPQPKPGQQFRDIAPLPAETPTEYADLIFDKIGEIINNNADYLVQARTPEEILQAKHEGKKAIVLGIENGLALNGDLSNIKHFANRGITYITLCHNGDNDICDSARGTATHNGVSEFGEKVIQEMNRLGIMVDLSHASEKSFYDALEMSQTPIVCSHSCCRALSDHVRNLTDDQMRALARRGGIMQVNFYHGFLRSEGEATVIDALQHLRHAIDIMGIDHVGLGSDFDGDGGVRGIQDSAQMLGFTIHLLRQRYSDQDIAQIWGRNWLRVMAQVQGLASK